MYLTLQPVEYRATAVALIRLPFSDEAIPTLGDESPSPTIHIRQKCDLQENEVSSMTIECRLPSVHVNIDKAQLDCLLIWADDCAQWAERTFSSPQTATSSTNTSIIGSRYFAPNPRTVESMTTLSSRTVTSGEKRVSELVISLAITEGS